MRYQVKPVVLQAKRVSCYLLSSDCCLNDIFLKMQFLTRKCPPQHFST
uniref:Uncharacterized protein n=1 Tax=Anguilla anguilla TaxID=7936 RepID=A0A0E9W3Y4_ANGAN